MGIIAAGQITVVDLSDAPVLNTFITASRPTTQTYSKDSGTYNPSYASTPQVLTLKLTKAGSTANIIDSISSLHWFVVDGPIKTEITSKDNTANEYISGAHNEILTTKLDIDKNKGSKRYEVMGIWPDPSTGLDVQFGGYIDLLLTQNGATGPQGPQGDTGNGIANTVITYGLSMSDTTEPATWSSEMPALVKGMYLWTRTVIIYTNGSSSTSYQISYIAKDADATAEIDKAKQELLEKLETVRDESLEAVDEAKQQLVTVRDESLAAAEEAKQGLANVTSELNTAKQNLADSVTAVNTKVDSAKEELTQAKQQLTTVADELNTAKQDFQNAVSAVDTKATNLQSDLTQAKQDLASQAQQLQEQANAQSELTNRVSSVEETANGTKTTVSELSKTVAQNGKDITSVTARTKVVEDDLAGTKTTLSQVQTTANSTSQKTATLETGLNGLSAKFNSLSVGNKNYLPASRVVNRGCSNFSYSNTSKSWTMTAPASSTTFGNGITFNTSGLNILLNGGETLFFGLMIKANKACSFNYDVNNDLSGTTSNDNDDTSKRAHSPSNKSIPANVWTRVWFSYTAKANVAITEKNSKFGIVNNTEPVAIEIKEVMVAKSNVPVDYQAPDADLEQKIAEYKQTADQNYAGLQTTVQNLDGTVQHNKTVADQTAQGFSTRIESLETYKDGESERANAYFESAKTETAKQLTAERTAIAKDYVAKSTYTSDVTGIRNELTATTTTANTTKTNLANYQASNDRAVANLQSNIQTANGNISSLKTKVEAVPGQITSAVSSVESKIPKTVGGRNLALGTSADWSAGRTSFNGQENQSGTIYRTYNRGFKIGDKVNVRLVLKYSDIVVTEGQTARVTTQFRGNVTDWGSGQLNGGQFWFDKSDGEIELKGTTVVSENTLKNEYWDWRLRVDYVKRGKIQWKEAKVEVGDLPTPWSPAPEDTAEQISNLSSEIKQTADGMTLLATKTELSTAKNELQSGINTATNKANSAQNKANSNAQTISTHTTQISALNTGLSAKVSQTDFNTLSGRVTSAENNITAKANELSSKITSVEGKIPTDIGTVNLVKDTGSAFVMGYGITNTTWNETKKQAILDFSVPGVNLANSSEILPQGNKFCDFKPIKGTTYTQSIMIDTDATFNPNGQMEFTWFANGQHNSQKGYIKKVGAYSYQVWSTYTWNLENTALRAFDLNNLHKVLGFRNSGTYLAFYKPKLTAGNLPSDWSPSPEDTANQISSLSSELKQTKDGITLLATKTELNTAKNELQSGINTATNKANNNAQTISTHTTQISALNTGLQAKVSQSDFNTLSGRVTTAENNITAKANELSSKITSVEGKIPTSSGGRNLALGTSGDWSGDWTNFNGQNNQTRTIYRIYNRGFKIGDKVNVRIVLKYSDIVAADGQTARISSQSEGNVTHFGPGRLDMGQAVYLSPDDNEVVLSGTTTITDNHLRNEYWGWRLRVDYVASGRIQWKEAKAEAGDLPTPWSPAPEDTIEEISSLSSELKQTKDGITLLATKTELNTAKNELQSGINAATNKANNNAQTISTHTTQISALNTGLQAKVSQSDFNTLSGRVTNAENNITAKANELSSKITSVEGKIPTSSGGRNLAQGTSKDWSKPFTEFSGVQNTTKYLYRVLTDGLAVGDTFKTRIILKYTNIVPASGKTAKIWLQGDGNVTGWNSGTYPSGGSHSKSISGSGETVFELTDKIHADHLKNNYWNWAFRTDWIASGSLQWKLAKAERGMFFTDWSPAPEDTISQISAVSSELKQTADGMTLLATKTELNTAKNDLQSGINAATNKANSAQNKANSNAQTISTHTTQISALNTGLQAKVSQTDFNTLSGRVTSAENNITAKANELSSKITSVEGKIPTSIGGRNLWIQSKVTGGFVEETLPDNHITGQKKCYRLSNNQEIKFNIEPDFSSRLYRKVTFSAWVKYENVVQGGNNWNNFNCFKHQLYRKNSSTGATTNTDHLTLEGFTGTSDWKYITYTYDYAANKSYDQLKTSIRFNLEDVRSGTAWVTGVKIEIGSIPSDYSPAPEDTATQISSLSSELKQTKDGITLLATKTELNTAKSDLQSGINTATNKANAAQNTANSAQNKANSNAQTISTHTTQISALNTGLQAKVSQTDFNTLSGRVTTAENNITAKANELSSKITSVEGKIPTSVGTVNLIKGTGSPFIMGYGITNTTWNETKKQTILDFSTPGVDRARSGEILPQENKFFDFKPIKGTTYTQSIMIDTDATFNPNGQAKCSWFANGQHNHQKAYIKKVGAYSYQVWSTYTWNLENTALRAFDWYDLYTVLGFRNSGTYLAFYKPKLTTGNLPSDWSPAPEDTISQISSLSSEFKQTTDSIKASVSSLDKSTVKSSSLTINSDGIVMKAGKSTTDVANAIGSYFAVNQNAIDLFADKIKVKGNMIVNGTITGDKIKASSVDVSKIVGIDANFIKSKIEYAMIDWLKGKTITAYNDNMTIDLQNGRVSFKDGSNAVYRQTPDGIHTGFLHFEAGSLGGVYAAFGTTSTRQGINSKSSEFAGIRCYRVSANGDSHDAKIDKIEVIGDNVQFGHTYHPNGTIGGGFIMNTAAYYDDPPYSLNRMVSSIESLWRILYVHAKNVGYNLSHPNFIRALNDEYNAWHDMHNR